MRSWEVLPSRLGRPSADARIHEKYAALSAGSPDEYARAVVADHAFLVAIPMWCVAGVVALVRHSIFPDRTDFRILMAEPLSRLTIFTSKLASLLLFVDAASGC